MQAAVKGGGALAKRIRRARPPGSGNGVAMARSLGALEESVEHIAEGLDREREENRLHRESIRNIMEAQAEATRVLTGEVSGITGQMGNIKSQLDDLAPDVKDYRERRAELRGATKMGKTMWLAIVGVSGGIGVVIGWVATHVTLH